MGLEIWVSSYISPIVVDYPWAEGQGVIKKGTINLNIKFGWIVVHYRLCLTDPYKLLTRNGAALLMSMMSSYDIDFLSIIIFEHHEQAFGDIMILFFH